MATKGKRPMRALTPSDKIEAIQRVNDGESKASVARDIGVPESTLRGWCKNEDKLRYMTSRLSSPDTDKSNDGEPPDKRARTESPTAVAAAAAVVAAAASVASSVAVPKPPSPATAGLDLTAPCSLQSQIPQPIPPPVDAPVELTTKRSEPSPIAPPPRSTAHVHQRRSEPGASVSMSAISPLTGLAHLPGLTNSHLGLSFNEIATNLTLLAQLNPGLSALSAQPASRALRSVRSPKPAHNGVLNLNEHKHRSKTHSTHSSDPYHLSSSKSSHHSTSSSQPVDDTLWYWLKTQQAMLGLTAQNTAAHPLQLGKVTESNAPPKPIAPIPPQNSHLDYNRNSWLWQYYKQFGGAMPLPEDKLKSASQVPKVKSENILYSQLIKGKDDDKADFTRDIGLLVDTGISAIKKERVEDWAAKTNAQFVEHKHNPHDTIVENSIPQPNSSPREGVENKEPIVERSSRDNGKIQTKARTVLDNLLFNNNNSTSSKEVANLNFSNVEWESGDVEALEHGEKFLAWLELSGDPSVTRMHVHQLRALLHNLRARRVPAVTETVDHSHRN